MEVSGFDKFDSLGFEPNPQTIAAGGKPKPISASVIIGQNQDGSLKTARFPGAFSSNGQTPYESTDEREILEQARTASGEAMFNEREPHYLIQHQQPKHLIIILLKAQGLSNKAIADQLGMSSVAVSNIVRQPWAREQITKYIREAGRDEVLSVFKNAALDAAEAVVEIVNNDKAKANDKIAAANVILDRLYGKATQPLDVNLTEKALKQMSDEDLLRIATGGNN